MLGRATPADRRGRPLSADALFYHAFRGDYDAVVAMYHDQGLVPLKMVGFETGVNWTLGLPFIRTSPDHGTAYDIAGQGNAESFEHDRGDPAGETIGDEPGLTDRRGAAAAGLKLTMSPALGSLIIKGLRKAHENYCAAPHANVDFVRDFPRCDKIVWRSRFHHHAIRRQQHLRRLRHTASDQHQLRRHRRRAKISRREHEWDRGRR